MTPDLSNTVFAGFLIFCRIGACIMIAPGFSSSDIPVQIRLMIALAASLGLSPMLMSIVYPVVADVPLYIMIKLIVSELLIGAIIGLMGRMFYLGLQTMATAIAMSIGLSSALGVPIDDAEPVPALAALVAVAVGTLFFVTDQHSEVLRGLASSYRVWQPSQGLGAEAALEHLSDTLSEAFMVSLRVASPFMIYGVVVNVSVGLINKLTPTIPVYFISGPFVLFGGLILAYLIGSEMLLQFMMAFSAWMVR